MPGIVCNNEGYGQRAFQDRQCLLRGMVQKVARSAAGRMGAMGIAVKLADTGGNVRLAAPLLGEHIEDVIEQWRGARGGSAQGIIGKTGS